MACLFSVLGVVVFFALWLACFLFFFCFCSVSLFFFGGGAAGFRLPCLFGFFLLGGGRLVSDSFRLPTHFVVPHFTTQEHLKRVKQANSPV